MRSEYFTDLAGTIPAKPGEPVALMRVRGDEGQTLVYEQPTTARRPTLSRDGTLPRFDGVDDLLVRR